MSWLDSMPSSWELRSPKSLFNERRTSNLPDDVHLTPSQKYGVLPQSEYIELTGGSVVLNLTGQNAMKHVEPNDFIIHLRSFQGGLERARQSGKVSTAYTVVEPKNATNPEFYKWLFKSKAFIQELQTTTNQLRDGQSIRWTDFVKVPLPTPSLDEQRAIADYLDRETQKIDELITEQRGLIETLRERSRALIERAVTRGVSGDATESSEIPWLYGGQVVAHWTTSRIKYMFSSLRAGAMIPADSISADGDYPVYGGNGKRGYTSEFTHDGVHILIGRQGALCGNVHLCQGRFWSSEHAIVGEPVRNVAPRWLEFLLRIMNLGQYSMASAQPGIGVGQIATLQIPFPPLSEQREIIEYLDGQTARIDELIAESEGLIALSQERRAALITAAVTGRIDVREEA